ncbi:MAG: phosphonate C-P lyase system protein PhnH [Pseudomonadota bacterium]
MSTAEQPAADVFHGGFPDPVFDAQSVFRSIMDALARPGTIAKFSATAMPPDPLSPTIGSIAATLFDHDTRIWLDAVLARNDEICGWLSFHTSAPISNQTLDADFAIISDAGSLPSLESFSQGSQEYPDRSTTMILQVPDLDGGRELELSGPGIRTSVRVTPRGLPEHFIEQWALNRTRFPRGVDMLLAAPEGVIALPRTVKISVKEP